VYEYVQGKTLDELILASPQRKIDLKKAIDIINQACMGLTHAHTQNVIHRDLKPSNIMVEESGNVKVMDFGVARIAKDSLMITTTGKPAGTGYYLAPEQAYGKSSRVSDLYALAVTFYEMLTGQRPFSGGTVQNDKLDGSFTLPSQMGGFPPGLDAFFKTALDPRPEKRFQNTREFMGGLDRAVEGA
jgi:serine/threonine-protein kinase